MNITDYLPQLLDNLGFPTVEDAKARLSPKELRKQAHAYYQSNNGADGTVLWTEVLSALALG